MKKINLIKPEKKHTKKIIFFSILLLISIVIFFPFLYPWLFYNKSGKNEVVIIGLEGATWRVIKPMIDKGELPNFKFLIENGSYGTVNSSTLSHDVWDNIAKDKLNKNFWEIASKKNETIISLYWPNSIHNESKIHDLKGSFFINNPLSEFFKKLYYLKILVPVNKADKDLIYDFYLLDYKMREFFYSREKIRPDLSGVVLSELPKLQLYYWAYMEPERFQNLSKDDIEKYGNVIEEYYKEFDSYLGKLIREKNVTIIVLSGYGFDATIPQKTIDKILVNKILEDGGLLRFDYRGEIDFSKTKAYSLEEGLEEETIIYINAPDGELETIKTQVYNIFSKVSIDSKQVFDVSRLERGLILKRNVPLQITDKEIVVSNRRYPIEDFILRRVISGRTTEEGILIIYGKNVTKGEIHNATISGISLVILRLSNVSI
jgi:hypothetical protein